LGARSFKSDSWFKKVLSSKIFLKSRITTPKLYLLHETAHDFGLEKGASASFEPERKLFSASLSHVALLLGWISGLLYLSSTFSNYSAWVSGKAHLTPSSSVLTEVFGQEMLNAPCSYTFEGLRITSGLFSVFLGLGFSDLNSLKDTSETLLFWAVLVLLIAYYFQHFGPGNFYKRLGFAKASHLIILAGLGSVAFSGHLYHVSRVNLGLLGLGLAPGMLPPGSSMLENPLGGAFQGGFRVYSGPILTLSEGALPLDEAITHHLFLGNFLVILGIWVWVESFWALKSPQIPELGSSFSSHHFSLSLALALLA
jgi:photosystem I P700 chlorophyll a apoprotein A1